MRKHLTALITVLLLTALLCGCTGQNGTQATATPAEKTLSASAADVYSAINAQIDMPEMMQVPESLILDFYGIGSEDYTDAVFCICADSLKADEIVIVKAVDQASADKVEQKLNTRLNQKAAEAETYSPEQYAIIKKCTVRRDGLTVAMLVTPEVEQATKTYEGYLK